MKQTRALGDYIPKPRPNICSPTYEYNVKNNTLKNSQSRIGHGSLHNLNQFCVRPRDNCMYVYPLHAIQMKYIVKHFLKRKLFLTGLKFIRNQHRHLSRFHA